MSKKIMVVDDSRTVRQQVGIALKEAGYDVVEAHDGVDGAEKISAATDLAMVVCDVHMPRMDGLEMVSVVKSDPRNALLPMLMLTTEGQPSLIARAKESGAKGWIVKPFKAETLLAAVKKIVGAA